MKIKTIFIILFGIWLIDFILTFVVLNFFSGFVETSPVANFFFSLGIQGFFLFFIVNLFGCLIMSFLIHKMSYNKFNRKSLFTLWIGLSIFFIIEADIIINNLYWLIK